MSQRTFNALWSVANFVIVAVILLNISTYKSGIENRDQVIQELKEQKQLLDSAYIHLQQVRDKQDSVICKLNKDNTILEYKRDSILAKYRRK